eukprot:TRINITY_DN16590_c0_g1_i1.p1 TRINITY_DN16590_c0_g1~~TRINITY_DN16590_c0_g1_i1.p1  ORF type:complete len:113 (-),score=17.46 TRINITY_DN16590_c0_g1_i1:197-535(-)
MGLLCALAVVCIWDFLVVMVYWRLCHIPLDVAVPPIIGITVGAFLSPKLQPWVNAKLGIGKKELVSAPAEESEKEPSEAERESQDNVEVKLVAPDLTTILKADEEIPDPSKT